MISVPGERPDNVKYELVSSLKKSLSITKQTTNRHYQTTKHTTNKTQIAQQKTAINTSNYNKEEETLTNNNKQ